MKALILLNHPLTEEQKKELQNRGVLYIEEPPEEVKKAWGSIPTGKSSRDVTRSLLPVFRWLEDNKNASILIVQGEMNATMQVVLYAYALGIPSLSASTCRVVEEKQGPNGEVIKKSVFKHAGFRPYPTHFLDRALYGVAVGEERPATDVIKTFRAALRKDMKQLAGPEQPVPEEDTFPEP